MTELERVTVDGEVVDEVPDLWVQFHDMHSGGGTKIPPYEDIYIQTPNIPEAVSVFRALFRRDPDNVTCGCCGKDYAYYDAKSLADATAYGRNDYPGARKYVGVKLETLETYRARRDVRFVSAQDFHITDRFAYQRREIEEW